MRGTPDEPESHVWVDTDRREVVVVAGPFHVQQMVMNEAEGMEQGEHGGHESLILAGHEFEQQQRGVLSFEVTEAAR